MGENRKDNRQIKFRVSDHEYEELEQTANNFHMSVPAFAKKRALGYRMKPPKVDKSGAIEIAKQLRAIGNNVNQLTRRANASNGKIDSEELQAIKKELHEIRSEEHTSELQSRGHLVCRLLLEKKNDYSSSVSLRIKN